MPDYVVTIRVALAADDEDHAGEQGDKLAALIANNDDTPVDDAYVDGIS